MVANRNEPVNSDAPNKQRITSLIQEARACFAPDLDRALALAEQAYALLTQLSEQTARYVKVDLLALLVKANYQVGQLDHALQYGSEGLAAIDDKCPAPGTYELMNRLVWTYIDLGLFDQARALNNRMTMLAQMHGERAHEAQAYRDLSVMHGRLGDVERAREAIYRTLAPDLFEALPPEQKAVICFNLADTFFADGKTDEAERYIMIGLEAQPIALLHYMQGWILMESGEDEAAERAYDAAMVLARESHDLYDQQAIQIALAELRQRQGRFDEAIARAQAALALVETLPVLQLDCLDLLIRLYVACDDYRSAFTYLRQHSQAETTLYNRHTVWRAHALEIEYQTEALRREQAALAEQNTLLEQLVSERSQAIETQQQLLDTIMQLTAPALPLVPGVLVLPIVGNLDSVRVIRLTNNVLEAVNREQARVLIIDITGLSVIDTQVTAALLTLANTTRLLGCRTIVVGIRPEIAQSLISLGGSLSELTTRATLAEGLEVALGFVGKRIIAR